MKRPKLAHWCKYHWNILRWFPFGGIAWRWANDRMDEFYEAR